jgi:hypothetical protein
VGTGPKSEEGEQEVALIREIENTVKDAIIAGVTDDRTLDFLIDLAIWTKDGAQAVSQILDQPHFYAVHFVPWVREGLQERQKIKAIEGSIKDKAGGRVQPPHTPPC